MSRKQCKRKERQKLIPSFILGRLPAGSFSQHIRALRLTRHEALSAIAEGIADETHVELVLASLNISEALAKMIYEGNHLDEIVAAKAAMRAMVKRRPMVGGQFIFGLDEYALVCRAFEIHDAQLDDCTVEEVDAARRYVEALVKAKRAEVLEPEGVAA